MSLEGHPGPPDGLADEPGPVEVPGRLAVEHGGRLALGVDLVMKGAPGPVPFSGRDVLVPDRGRLVDVAVDVDDRRHQ